MTGPDFTAWPDEMKSAGLARSDADAGRQLGKSTDRIVAYKKDGADQTIALACTALLHRMQPYGGRPTIPTRPRRYSEK